MDTRDIDIVPEDPSTQAISLARETLKKAFANPEALHYDMLHQFSNMIRLSSRLSSVKSDLEQQLRSREREVEHFREALSAKENTIKEIKKEHQKDVDLQKDEVHKILNDKKLEWMAKEKGIRWLQAKVHEIESERNKIQENYDTVIRKLQEESFKQMESGRWLPSEGSTVVRDLDRIKREMKSWAKGTSIKDRSPFHTLDVMNVATLIKDLSYVVLLDNNQLPQGLSTPKSSSLLLNALLAHDVYTTIFRNPFFFLNDGLGHDLPRAGPESTLNEIYQLAQAGRLTDDEEEALANYLS